MPKHDTDNLTSEPLQDFTKNDQGTDQFSVSVDPSVLNQAIPSEDTTERFD
jgi:hypothetical protein